MSNEHAYNVVYTPSNVASYGKQQGGLTDELLDLHGVKFIRVTWVDWINNVRYRVIPRAYFKKLLESDRPGVSITKAAFGLVALALAPGFTGAGEDHYIIDTSSFRLSPYAPGHATVFGFFQQKVPHPEHGLAVPYCPRALLKRIVKRAQDEAGVSYLAGFEHEFILLSATKPKIVPVNEADWSVSSKMPCGAVETTVMEEIAMKLAEAGIELQMYHAEAAPGQYEVVTGPLPPLEAADACISTRETIYNVASKHGLRATFAPRLYSNSTGSAAHTHISVHKTRPDKTKTRADDHLGPTMTQAERSFLQGVLDHAPALCALTLPTKYSYARVADGIWSGGTYASWGTDQREAPVRLTGAQGRHHFEVRFVDGTASPYLVLAGLLGAGTEALVREALLKSADCFTPVAQMSEEQRAAHGVQNAGRLPTTVEQARKNFAADGELKAVFGDDFVEKYNGVNALLETVLTAETEDETVTKLVNFY
ncbi:glutamine synthetase [Phanerochaete sordida]|uniref:Glutamine synthetase n=1 Tax=Phanerochaete sordida TaxID=48140 RepID=A0A9P3GNF9_9APHY|nr:glutamine synthetase [Phanerochaete sordida]